MSLGLAHGLTALGLVFVIEGLVLAASPQAAKRFSALMISRSPAVLRAVGLGAMVAGVALVWLVRH